MANKTMTKMLSIILLLCCLLIPMINIFPEGLMPDGDSWFFTETLTTLIDEGMEAFSYVGVTFHFAAWVPAIIVCFGAFLQKKRITQIASILGIITLIGVLLFAVVNLDEIGLAHPMDGYICIGYWIDLVLFAVCAFFSSKELSVEA